ncbi:hypothetical protein PCK1_000947 [Pneumocystis canis]|nr:hypothetical protein PCK1_000947 [Pneumocystis canis]
MKKSKKKHLDDNIWDELGEDIPSQNINENDYDKISKKEINYDFSLKVDELAEDFGELMSTLKKSKNKSIKKKEGDVFLTQKLEILENSSKQDDISFNQNYSHENNKSGDQKSTEIPEIKLKTKREKEKEKKEREKAKRKAQLKEKGSMDKSVVEKIETPEIIQTNEQLNKSQVKVKISESKPKEKTGNLKTEESSHDLVSTKKSKTKKINIAALQKQMELRIQAEEQRRKQEEEERRIIEEEERKIQEEERRKQEIKSRKREREKAKKELLKNQGKFLTKKQKEQQQIAQIKIQQLLAAGVRIEGLVANEKLESSSSGKSNRLIYDSKKKKSKMNIRNVNPSNSNLDNTCSNNIFESNDTPDSFSQEIDKNSEISEANSEDDVIDDWEKAFDDDNNIKDFPNINAKKSSPKVSSKDSQVESLKTNINNYIEKINNINDSQTQTQCLNSEKEDIPSRNFDLKKNQNSLVKKNMKNSHDTENNLRSPICCILGHVDSGKTKILDKIRQTNVQEGEAGGITQQIGATYFPMESIKQKVAVLDKDKNFEYKLPGLLIIDTPGHESFTNLRSRGSSLCDIAILVVDIMHGLERQTLESLNLLRNRKTPFIVALNKIDRIYGWNSTPNAAFQESLSKQKKIVEREFHDRYMKIVTAFSEQGLNSVVYYNNKNFAKNVSIVPTSALTGEGIPDMLMLLVELTQKRMSNKLMYLAQLEATVLEVKVIEGHGTTIDVILSNGVLKEGDRIVLCGLNGAIATNVRALLTPQPLKELRIKSTYIHNKEIKAASGVKISANDLDKAIAGSRLMVVGPNDNEEEIKEEIMEDLHNLLNFIDTSGVGVSVQASTLGSLEALLEFLKQNKVPVSTISIGPVHKKDKMIESKKEENASEAIFPCVLKTIAVFNKKDPILLGVDIIEGVIRIGTPICAVKVNPNTQTRLIVDLGRVISIEKDHKVMNIVKKEQVSKGVAIKIESSQILFGRQVDEKDILYSHITRKSIDILKEIFRDEVSKEEWNLIRKLKTVFGIT